MVNLDLTGIDLGGWGLGGLLTSKNFDLYVSCAVNTMKTSFKDVYHKLHDIYLHMHHCTSLNSILQDSSGQWQVCVVNETHDQNA